MRKATVIWPLTIMSALIISVSLIVEPGQWKIALIGAGIIIGLGMLDSYTPKIAQLPESDLKVKTMRRLNRFFMVFFTAVFAYYLWYPGAEALILESENGLAFIVTLAVMGIIGGSAPKLPFNRYMGLRLPWTVRDEETWNVAHKWLSYVTFPVIILMITAYFFNIERVEVVKYGVLSWIAIPAAYSGWIYYKRMG